MLLSCPTSVVAMTLTHLRASGARECECVVLWLGRRTDDGHIVVKHAYRPLHRARADVFHIPPEGMAALHAELRRGRLMVAAQVHSHPGEAFHSIADDRWAVIRHEGALSLVVPNFAARTRADNFLEQTKVFRFSNAAEWLEVPHDEVERSCLRIH